MIELFAQFLDIKPSLIIKQKLKHHSEGPTPLELCDQNKFLSLVWGGQHIFILALDFFNAVATIWCPNLARPHIVFCRRRRRRREYIRRIFFTTSLFIYHKRKQKGDMIPIEQTNNHTILHNITRSRGITQFITTDYFLPPPLPLT